MNRLQLALEIRETMAEHRHGQMIAFQTWPFVYGWGNNAKRATLKGRRCRILAGPSRMRTVLIEFENGQRETSSVRALRNRAIPA